jgi:hypothetical protein
MACRVYTIQDRELSNGNSVSEPGRANARGTQRIKMLCAPTEEDSLDNGYSD